MPEKHDSEIVGEPLKLGRVKPPKLEDFSSIEQLMEVNGLLAHAYRSLTMRLNAYNFIAADFLRLIEQWNSSVADQHQGPHGEIATFTGKHGTLKVYWFPESNTVTFSANLA